MLRFHLLITFAVSCSLLQIQRESFAQSQHDKQNRETEQDQSKGLPSPEEIISEHFRAIGGKKNVEAIKTVKIEFVETVIRDDDPGKPEFKGQYLAAGKKWKIQRANGSVMGFDGKNYWRRASATSKSKKVDTLARPGSFLVFDPTGTAELFAGHSSIKVVAMKETESGAVYRYKMKPVKPPEPTRIQMTPSAAYFDAMSKRITQVDYEYKTCTFKDYKKVGRFTLPHRCEVDVDFTDIHQKNIIELTSVKIDRDVDGSEFDFEPRK